MADAVSRRDRGFRRPLSVLILAQDLSATEDLFRPCDERLDLWTIRVPSVTACVAAMRVVLASLIIVAPEIASEDVTILLGEIEHLRSETPVLLLREAAAEIHPGWQSRRMAVLRCPLVPGLLDRAVDLALRPARRKRDRARMN